MGTVRFVITLLQACQPHRIFSWGKYFLFVNRNTSRRRNVDWVGFHLAARETTQTIGNLRFEPNSLSQRRIRPWPGIHATCVLFVLLSAVYFLSICRIRYYVSHISPPPTPQIECAPSLCIAGRVQRVLPSSTGVELGLYPRGTGAYA